MKFRVTYSAAKRENTYRRQVVNGHETEIRELLDSRVAFHEEKTVLVEAKDEADAIEQATKHLPKDAELSVLVHKIGPAIAVIDGPVTPVPEPESPKPEPEPEPAPKPTIKFRSMK